MPKRAERIRDLSPGAYEAETWFSVGAVAATFELEAGGEFTLSPAARR